MRSWTTPPPTWAASRRTCPTSPPSLSALVDRETEFQLFAESALESVESVDVAEAAAKPSELEVVLEASYAALASIMSVSLTDYVR